MARVSGEGLASHVRYGIGRASAVLSQLGIAIALSRALGREDLGLFSFTYVVSGTVGMLTGLSARRLVMHRRRDESATDILVAVLSCGLLGVVGTGVAGGLVGGPTGWAMGLLLGGWRLADSVAEIGQGWMCLDGRFGMSGALLAVRSLGTLLGVLIGIATGSWEVGLGLALASRMLVAVSEVVLSNPTLAWASSPRQIWNTTVLGLRFSSINCAVLTVDALPTAGVSMFGGLTEAALLTPLGRFRQVLHVAASSLSEVTYRHMVSAGSDRHQQWSFFRGNLKYLALIVVCGLVFGTLGGGALVFGDILSDERVSVGLAILAGSAIASATLFSATLTARSVIGIQVIGFSLYGIGVFVAQALFGWSVETMYLLQGVLGFTLLGGLMIWDRQRNV